MAERVVDALEVVEVHEHDGHRALVPRAARQREAEPVEEQRPVRQFGERVVQRAVAHRALDAAAVDRTGEEDSAMRRGSRRPRRRSARLARRDDEHAVGPRPAANGHGHPADEPGLEQGRGNPDPRLLREVGDDERLVGGEHVRGGALERAAEGGLVGEEALGPAAARADPEDPLGLVLDDHHQRGVECRPDRARRFAQQPLDRAAGDGVGAELGDRRLLGPARGEPPLGVAPARDVAHGGEMPAGEDVGPRGDVHPARAAVGQRHVALEAHAAAGEEDRPCLLDRLAGARPRLVHPHPQQVLPGMAEQLAGDVVDEDEAAVVVEEEEAVGRALEQRPVTVVS